MGITRCGGGVRCRRTACSASPGKWCGGRLRPARRNTRPILPRGKSFHADVAHPHKLPVITYLVDSFPLYIMSDFVDTNPGIDDRGEAKYFHGRSAELAAFKERMGFATVKHRQGTTFLILGAPGAGKSALLYKCAQLAEGQKWKVIDITLDALWDATTLLQALGRSKEAGQVEGAWSASVEGEVGVPGGVKARAGGSYERKKTPAPRNTLEVLKSGKGKLLLVLDEAQRLGKHTPQEYAHRVSVLLDAIHNGKLSRSVMLLAAGLSATADAFEEMGVSRFRDKCYIELGRLKHGAERKVIKDWLKKNGRGKGDPTPWIDAIARETHGWPQHVSAYAESAAIHLRATGREMTPEKLQAVLEAGGIKRTKFYEIRAKGLPKKERQCIARAMANVETDGVIDKDMVIESLREAFSAEKAEDVFALALRKGIFDLHGDSYVMPIPSMRRWFIDNYFI